MSNEEIKRYIDSINDGDFEESIFIRHLSESVFVAKVWAKQPCVTDSISESNSYRFFFVKNELGKSIAAILDMYSDLHWYVLPNERKKGLLTKALKEVIIPYIFYEREEQRITIKKDIGDENYRNSLRVATSLGFIPTNQDCTEFSLKKIDFDWSSENWCEKNNFLGIDRIEILKKRVNYASNVLLKISDELEMAYSESNELDNLSESVGRFTWKVEDLFWEYEKSD